MMEEILRPFEFEFFRNGLIVATLAGALCGMIGVYVVLKGMSYIGHGLSHAIFGGYAVSALIGINYVLGAGAWGVASALLINSVTRRRVIGADAAIGEVAAIAGHLDTLGYGSDRVASRDDRYLAELDAANFFGSVVDDVVALSEIGDDGAGEAK